MKDRRAFNDFFIIELIKISFNYIDKDAKANEINALANEVNAARIDLDNLQHSIGELIEANIEELEKVQRLVGNLIDKQSIIRS